MHENLVNGKDICLQRLRANKVAKSLRFLDGEIRFRLFDFNSKKYDFYRTNNYLIFKSIKKSDFKVQLEKNERPLWISKTEFSKISKTTSESIKLKLIDDAIKKYDLKTEKYYNELIRFSNKQNEYLKEKGQNILFNIEYLITGKLDSGDEIRFPFVLREIKKININRNDKKIYIEKTNKYVPNIPFITWLGNKQNKEIESKIEQIGFLDESNFIKKQINIYSDLGININEEDFKELNPKEIKLNRENSSLKNDLSIATHEAKHAIILWHYEKWVEMISINESFDSLGKTAYLNDDDEVNYKLISDLCIAPYLDENEFKIDNFKFSNIRASDNYIDKDKKSDYHKLIESINNNSSLKSYEDRERFMIESIKRTSKILEKYDAKLSLIIKYLQKHKIMDSDEVTEQFSSDILIESYYRDVFEIKLEKNSFQIEKVELIGVFEFLIDHELYNDAKEIFSNNYVDDLLEKKMIVTNLPFEEDKITWSFKADISQQKAVFQTINFDRLIIQGPPGTGKTQTILNIISEYLSRGMKILVVSEKITAVEVILERFLRDAKIITPLIFDLYNIENKGIKFFNNVGINFKKIVDFGYSEEVPVFTSMNKKILNLLEFSRELEKLDLINQYDKILAYKPSDEEFNILSKIKNCKIDKLKNINQDLYNDFVNWKRIQVKFTNILPSSISREIANKLVNLNKSKPYSGITWMSYLSLLTTGNEKIKFLQRSKLKKMEKEKRELDYIFNSKENFEILVSFIDFDYKKYSLDDEKNFEEYKIIIDNNLSINRLENILENIKYMSNFNKIKTKILSEDPKKYICINDREMLIKSQIFIMREHSRKIIEIMNKNKKISVEFERLDSRQVMNSKMKFFIKEYWNYIKEIFPVVLSTPELVSKYLPLEKNLFDVVIIDEASQFLLERSLPSLYRGKKIIISGDKQQLRPLIPGQRFDSSSELNGVMITEYKELIENESILDLFDYLYKENQVMLTTHYRSKRDELISFSNKNFYDGKLIFIENRHIKKYNPIEIVNVNGEWFEQKNKEEALKIIEILESLLTDKSSPSIGVILFTKTQANFIKKIIYKDNKHPLIVDALESYSPDSLFIKSLDQVQGEERDIIIFGITYGNNVQNYGWLSKRYGENRINVAITRSKTKMIIVKSHKHNEYRRINSSTTDSRGPEILFNFIEYAENIDNDQNKKLDKILKLESNYEEMTLFEKYLKNMNKKISKIILINEVKIYINEIGIAFYLIDIESLKNPREKIWFIEKILSSKNYKPEGIYLHDLF